MLPQSVLVSVQIFKLHYVLVLSRLRIERKLLPDMGVLCIYILSVQETFPFYLFGLWLVMDDGSCWEDILIKSWPAISGDGNEIAEKCVDSEYCAAEIFCDLLLLQAPDPRAWWYRESPSLEIWGRGYYQTLSKVENRTGSCSLVIIMTRGVPDKYHSMSNVNMAKIVMNNDPLDDPHTNFCVGACCNAAGWSISL